MLELRTRRDIIAALRHRGIHLKKSLGQNFLIDHNLLQFIVRAGEVDMSDAVLEIGAGSGLLTRHLAEAAAHVVSVEVDPRLAELCREHIAGLGNVSLLLCDALESKSRLNPAVLAAVESALHDGPARRLKCIANLPYAIGSIVIPLLLESSLPVQLMVFSVQKEVADRLAAGPGSKDYGALSVIVQAHARIQIIRLLGPKVFFPEPKVDSAIVRIEPTGERMGTIRNYDSFAELTRGLFSYRRKKVTSALAHAERFTASRERLTQAMARAGIGEESRADQLSVDQIIRLANELERE